MFLSIRTLFLLLSCSFYLINCNEISLKTWLQTNETLTDKPEARGPAPKIGLQTNETVDDKPEALSPAPKIELETNETSDVELETLEPETNETSDDESEVLSLAPTIELETNETSDDELEVLSPAPKIKLEMNETSDDEPEACNPINSVDELLAWEPDPEDWSIKVTPLVPRGEFCYRGNSTECNEGKCQKPERFYKSFVPKTLICHDMQGGYLDDKFVDGASFNNQYLFYSWPLADIFIYFSHQFITIPPLMWINAGHKNGVEVLGTIISEWYEGFEIWKEILKNETMIDDVTTKLVQLCVHYKFDGYLLNIENQILGNKLPNLELFLRTLKSKMGTNLKLIWYDSVSMISGSVRYQGELNHHNQKAFDICDGIFLDYRWRNPNLQRSALNAGSRKSDVYAGIDVFGRGCHGGFNCNISLAQIDLNGLSVAIFGQGWTKENLKPKSSCEFLSIEKRFWTLLLPYLYIRVPHQLPFETDFNQGISCKKGSACSNGKSKLWYNLASQSYQVDTIISENNVTLDIMDDSCVYTLRSNSEISEHRLLLCDFWSSVSKPIRFNISAKIDSDIPSSFIIVLSVDWKDQNTTSDLILKFSQEENIEITGDELENYNSHLDACNEINETKKVTKLNNGWVQNEYMLKFEGRITEVKIKTAKTVHLQKIRFDYVN